jgi:hypothetical protein
MGLETCILFLLEKEFRMARVRNIFLQTTTCNRRQLSVKLLNVTIKMKNKKIPHCQSSSITTLSEQFNYVVIELL